MVKVIQPLADAVGVGLSSSLERNLVVAQM